MNAEQITQINKNQYADELDHKVEVYDDVKATLKLCKTMIVALDPTSAGESFNRNMLIQYLDMARMEALLAALSADSEIGELGK